jgi:hypothetical protein
VGGDQIGGVLIPPEFGTIDVALEMLRIRHRSREDWVPEVSSAVTRATPEGMNSLALPSWVLERDFAT